MMILPGLALFYGGLARTKNMLSVMTQVGAVAALVTMLIWVGWGYSRGVRRRRRLGAIIGGFGKAFLHGVTADTDRGDLHRRASPSPNMCSSASR